MKPPLLSILLILLSTIIYLTASQSRPFPHLNRPYILSHRGTRLLAPENTFLAFDLALYLGTDVLETDVRLTRDNHLIIFHDDDLSAVTESSNAVRNLTLSELEKLDFAYHFRDAKSGDFVWRGRNVKFPTLDAFFERYWGDRNGADWIPVNVEIKEDEELAAETLANMVKKYDMEKVARYLNVVSRFCTPLDAFRKATNGRVPTASCEGEAASFFLSTRLQTLLSPLVPKYMVEFVVEKVFARKPVVEGYSFSNLQLPTHLAGGAISVASDDVVERAHALGKEVHFWVINTRSDMKRLIELRADALITDRTDVAVEVYAEYGRKAKQYLGRLPTPDYSPVFTVPEVDLDEPHECVGLLCVAIEHSRMILIVLGGLLIGLTGLGLILVWRICKMICGKHRKKLKIS